MKELTKRLRRSWKLVAGIPLLATLIAMTAQRLGELAWLDDVAYDQVLERFSPKPKPSEHLTLFGIDDRLFHMVAKDPELSRAFGSWPYARTFWARILQYAEARGAKAVVLDAVMDEPGSDPSGDVLLADTLAQARIPFFAGFSMNADPSYQALPKVEPLPPRKPAAKVRGRPPQAAEAVEDPFGEEPEPLSAEDLARALAFPVKSDFPVRVLRDGGRTLHPVPPIPALVGAVAGFGAVEPEQDEDGKLRRTRFVYADETNAYAVMPVVVAAHLLGAERLELTPGRLRLGGRELDINLDGTARIDFGGALRDRFRIVSLSQVVQDMRHLEVPEDARRFELEEALFKDKVIVIGGFATGTHDQKATPFESNAPGVMKQASMLESLLHGRFIVDAPPWASPLYALLLALLSFALIFGVRHTWVEAVWPPLGLLAVFVLSGLLVTRGHVFLSIATPSVALGLSSFGAIMVNHVFADRERERMRQMFSRYLSKQVVSQLVQQEKLPELSGENMQVTAFFSDIRGFSTFSEKYKDDARGLVRILNTYLTRVSAVLMDHGACLDKYIGDAVVCIFGAPVRYPNHAVRACEGALAAQAEVSRLREEFRQQGLPDVYTRIGLNTAEMFVGNIGSEQLFNYTAIGDGMNLAARLEGANKNFGSGIMIGPLTYELAKDAIEARELDWVRVAGKTEPVAVYELLAMKGGISSTKRRVVDLYHQALGLYRAGNFEEAEKVFAQALEVDPGDGPAEAMRTRCKKLMLHPPPMPFDGVANLEK